MHKINVLIADGRKLLREGVASLLQKCTDLRVVGEAETAELAAKLVAPLAAKVVILNVAPPGDAMSAAVRAILAASANVRVVALPLNPSPPVARLLLDAGATGYLTKECTAEELAFAVRAVARGAVYVSSHAGQPVLGEDHVPPSRRATLAPREREILRRIASGQSTKQIAHELGVGSKTVETHRRRMMEKLNRHSVAELTQYAIANGLIPLQEA